MEIQPTRNLALDLVRATEAAAMAAGRWMGRGDKKAADKAAAEAMRLVLHSIPMDGIIMIGEGEKDRAPALFEGECLGTGLPPRVDIAVAPIDGTRPLANGLSNSISAAVIAPRQTLFNPGPVLYMNKIAVGPAAKGVINIDAPVSENLVNIARALGKQLADLTVVIQERPRNELLIAEVRQCGCRVRLFLDGDISSALVAAWPEAGIDALMGIGGIAKGVIAACALGVLGGEFQGKLWARNPDELERGRALGYDFDQPLTQDDLVASDDIFFAATAITGGEFLEGVRYTGPLVHTDSLALRGLSGTVRRIRSSHRLEKLNKISSIEY
jgi:fructose-1,6-bisphosphatase II